MKKLNLFILICMFALWMGGCAKNGETENENDIAEDSALPENLEADNTADHATDDEAVEPVSEELVINIQDFYTANAGDPSNLYYIDENKVLWGSGRNNCGQLGQGTQDYEFYEEMVKIAEDVIHVDYSQTGFVIYLTEDHKLYGMGNAGGGALQQYEEFDWTRFVNGEHYYLSEPYLLMENVKYACCGRDDVACLTEDGAVWVWGTIYFMGSPWSYNAYFVEKPKKILDNAVLVTGGWFNHAALLQDGTVWTWGYNSAGNCGIAYLDLVGDPTMVAEDVVMVWTNLEVGYYPLPDEDDIAMVWTGRKKYNREYDNIAEFDGIYPMSLNNTVIRKSDGSYWVCGENVGTEEKIVHGAEADYSVICTYEFHPCENIGETDHGKQESYEEVIPNETTVDWGEIYYERYYAIWDSEEMMLSEISNRSIYRDNCSFYNDAIYYIQGGGGGYMMKTDISYLVEPLYPTDLVYVEEEVFKDYPPLLLYLLKNEIYARHGYIFSDQDLDNYFRGLIWYTPQKEAAEFDVSVFNEIEVHNLDILARLDTY